MLATDFASNEEVSDALLSLKILCMPWAWYTPKQSVTLTKKLLSFFPASKNIFFFSSGRGALHALLQSLRLSPKDEVLVQAFTCEAVVLPIIDLDLKPKYVDINPQTYSMNPELIEKAITDKTKVLILQHTFGILPKREQILTIAKKHSLIVVEDLAHGFDLKTFKNDPADTVKLLSFGRSKAFSSVTGGAIINANESIADELKNAESTLKPMPKKLLISYLLYKPLGVFITKTYDFFIGKLLHQFVIKCAIIPREISPKERAGYYDKTSDFAYPNALSELLINQINKYDQKLNRRSSICSKYNRFFSINNPYLDASLIRFPLYVKDPISVNNFFATKNIFLGKWYNQPVAPMGLDLAKVEYKIGECPIAEDISKHIINLPTHCSQKDSASIVTEILSLKTV